MRAQFINAESLANRTAAIRAEGSPPRHCAVLILLRVVGRLDAQVYRTVTQKPKYPLGGPGPLVLARARPPAARPGGGWA